MAMRLESTSGSVMGSSFLPVHEGRQPPAPAEVLRHNHLPERYGVPLFELLVVDPYFIFISWEIPPQQIAAAQAKFGPQFEQRRLRVVLSDATSGAQIAARELYGDIGRWFIRLEQPGRWLQAELLLAAEDRMFLLNSAGPVFIPRDRPVEPERWEELFVTYGRGEKGELRIEATARELPAWPKISLKQPGRTGDSPAGSFTSSRRRIASELLRPLLPLAPASVEEDGDD